MSNLVGILGCTAIGNLLKKSECNILILELEDNALDDKCINILIDAFITNNTLKKLTIVKQKFVTPIGWCVFSAYLSNSKCSFDKVCFHKDLVDDAVLISLGHSVSINKNVNRVSIRHVQGLGATPLGWRAFSTCLRSRNSVLKVLHLDQCNIDNVGAKELAAALVENTSVKKFRMSDNPSISSSGWIDCLELLMNSPTTLVDINLSKNNIDDAGAMLLRGLLRNVRTLRVLDILHCNSITTDGWRAIAGELQSSTLRMLNIGGIWDANVVTVDDGLITSLANVLTFNSSLKTLFLGFSISEIGCSALVNALCNQLSIENTFSSNHTLFHCDTSNGSLVELQELLRMNVRLNKSYVAQKKILIHHFADEGNCVHTFGNMQVQVVPTALSFIGRDHLGYSLMHSLLRSMPWLMKPKLSSCVGQRNRHMRRL
jgi:hypothetical protein